jgi:hypothetical protein
VSDNLVSGGIDSTQGGAFFIMQGGLLTAFGTVFSTNTARCADGASRGGAIYVFIQGRLAATDVEFVENRADAFAGAHGQGGALYIYGSAEIQGATFLSNSAFGGSTRNEGGAVACDGAC